MRSSQSTPEAFVEAALQAIEGDRSGLTTSLNQLPAAIYVTDCTGLLTHYNDACVEFAGRTPVPLEDRWCVRWKLFQTNGAFLPHDQCPMATAIREKRAVRGAEAIAKRPDGSRVNFVPYPTPFFDAEGKLAGAVNLLEDVTDLRKAAHLRDQAARCRRFASAMSDRLTADRLTELADEYEADAARVSGFN